MLEARGAHGTDEELREAAREYKGHGLALTLLGSYLAEVAAGDIRRRKEIGPLEEAAEGGEHARRVMAAYERWFGKPEVAILHMIGLFDRPAEEDEIAALRAPPVIDGLTTGLHVDTEKKWYNFLVPPPTRPITEQEWNKAVAKLRKVGLLSAEQDKRIDAHPLVREHFGEQLRWEEPEAWQEGHRRLYEHLKAKAKELPKTVEEMAPLYAAMVHGCLAGMNLEVLGEVWWTRIRRGDKHFSTKNLGAFGSEVAVLSAFFDPPWERIAPEFSEPDQAFILHEAGFALRALGRLAEAAGLLLRSMEMAVAQEDWRQAGIRATNLSELLQSQGKLSEAVAQARKSIEFADKGGGDAFPRMFNRTTLAAALHAMGRREEAAAQFAEAERIQKERQPAYPLLYALQGFRYCDLLLDQGRDAEVRKRAEQTLKWTKAGLVLLDLAVEHLALGRAHLLSTHRSGAGDLAEAASHVDQAISGLRRSGNLEHLSLGLLARAALHTHTRAFPTARRDLDEALTIATRCGFRLHEADAHLGHARLCLAEGRPEPAREHFAKAREIIEQTGYHRRDEELTELTTILAATAPADPLP